MATILLLTNALQPSAEVLPALGLLLHQVRVAPAEGAALLDAPPCDAVLVDGRRDLATRAACAGCIRTTGIDVPLLLVLDRGRARGRHRRLGRRRRAARHRRARPRSRPGCGWRSAGCGAPRGRRPRRRSAPASSSIDEATYTARVGRPHPRPDLQGVRAAQVPRAAPGPGLHPRPAAAGGLGLRLLRRHAHRRRPRAPAAGQARPRARAPHRHGAQRRLPLRARRAGGRRPSTSPTPDRRLDAVGARGWPGPRARAGLRGGDR